MLKKPCCKIRVRPIGITCAQGVIQCAFHPGRLSNSAGQRLQLGESLPGLGSINAVYSGMGWTQSSVGRWLPPGQGSFGELAVTVSSMT